MRFAPTLIAVALLASACSPSSAAPAPSVTIDSVDVSGSHVSVVVTTGEDGPVQLTVDWGDGTSEPEVRSIGAFVFDHTYAGDVTSATISARATASDGSVASDIAAVEVSGGATTTSLAALDTTTTSTTTTLPPTTTTSTTTTLPPTTTTSTTTTQPPTTTTSTTTTQPPPTTTTIPPPVVVTVDLKISDGKIFDQWGSGAQETTWNGKTATATVTRHKDTWESDGIAIVWTIPVSAYEGLKAGASLMQFDVTVNPLMEFVLETAKLDGNAALVKYEFAGTYDASWSSAAWKKSIKEGFLSSGKSGAEWKESWTIDSTQFGHPHKVYMFFECEAKGPGGLIVGSDSHCDASMRVNAIQVKITAYP
ncbi:MAG: hypothetical protein ABFR95_05630 [Actinomycetota bacterium]